MLSYDYKNPIIYYSTVDRILIGTSSYTHKNKNGGIERSGKSEVRPLARTGAEV